MEKSRLMLLAAVVFGACLSAVPLRAGNQAAPLVEIIDWGVNADVPVVGVVPSDTLVGHGYLLDPEVDVPITERTLEIPACIGTQFGIKYRVNPAGAGDGAPIKVRLKHPLQTAPDGRTKEMSSWNEPRAPGTGFTGWRFEFAYELVEGEWEFALMTGEDVLASKTFTVVKAGCKLVS